MDPLDHLPDTPLSQRGTITADFLAQGITRFREAARFVTDLPYGRTKRRGDFRSVLTEGRGTCSTKHALLAALAREQSLSVRLLLGVFEMTAKNTPPAAEVLATHGLDAVPEAHCYLEVEGRRIDLTTSEPSEMTHDVMHEEPIAPLQVGSYKEMRHREVMATWLGRHHDEGRHVELDVDRLWAIREACIERLETAHRSS